jgi:hypothetical protein
MMLSHGAIMVGKEKKAKARKLALEKASKSSKTAVVATRAAKAKRKPMS